MAGNVNSMVKRLSHSEVITFFEPIVSVYYSANPIVGPIPDCVEKPEGLWGIHQGFKTANEAAVTGETLKGHLRDALRPGYNEAVINFVDFVELASRKDTSLPIKLNMDFLYKGANAKPSKAKEYVPGAITSFNVIPDLKAQGAVSLKVGGRIVKGVIVEYTYGDASDEKNWLRWDTSGSGKITITNLESGRRCTFRAKLVGTNENGPWSHYITVTIP